MAYKRYIRKNGKLYGPYIYRSVRDKDGKVRNIYVGPAKTGSKEQRTFTLQPFHKGLLAAVAILCAVSAAAFFMIPTGLVVQQETKTQTVSIGKAFNESGEIGIELDDVPQSLSISGEIKGNGSVRIYAVSGDEVMVIYERPHDTGSPAITGMAVGGDENASQEAAVPQEPASGQDHETQAPAASAGEETVVGTDGQQAAEVSGPAEGSGGGATQPVAESSGPVVSPPEEQEVPTGQEEAPQEPEAVTEDLPAEANATDGTPVPEEPPNASDTVAPVVLPNDTAIEPQEPAANGTLEQNASGEPPASNATEPVATVPANETLPEANGTTSPSDNETLVQEVSNTTNATEPEATADDNMTSQQPAPETETLRLVDYCRDTCTVLGMGNNISIVVEVEPGTIVFLDEISYAYTVEIENATMQQPGMSIEIESPSNTSYGKGPIQFAVGTSEASDWCSFSLDDGEPVLMSKASDSRFEQAVSDIGSGEHHVIFVCEDLYGNLTSSETIHFSLVAPRVILKIAEPSGDVEAKKGEPFPVTIEVKCVDADCGDLRLALDPEKKESE